MALLSLICGNGFATEGYPTQTAKASPEFERIKMLVGKWEGTSATGAQTEPAQVEYHLTSGGSAVVETLFSGTPHEMVSVYHDEKGKLSMTHYCMLGNQPKLDLMSSDKTSMNFDLSPSSAIDPAHETHMHSLKLTFDGSDNAAQNWTLFENGQAKQTTMITLKRVAS